MENKKEINIEELEKRLELGSWFAFGGDGGDGENGEDADKANLKAKNGHNGTDGKDGFFIKKGEDGNGDEIQKTEEKIIKNNSNKKDSLRIKVDYKPKNS